MKTKSGHCYKLLNGIYSQTSGRGVVYLVEIGHRALVFVLASAFIPLVLAFVLVRALVFLR